ncbi:MAG: hypothetical protein QXY36_02855 [Sulfolobales archaeon]
MSSRADVIEPIKDLYGIVLFFRDNAVDDDFYEALDNVLRMIEEFLAREDVSEGAVKDFINKLYVFVRSNPLTKFLAIYVRDYL